MVPGEMRTSPKNPASIFFYESDSLTLCICTLCPSWFFQFPAGSLVAWTKTSPLVSVTLLARTARLAGDAVVQLKENLAMFSSISQNKHRGIILIIFRHQWVDHVVY